MDLISYLFPKKKPDYVSSLLANQKLFKEYFNALMKVRSLESQGDFCPKHILDEAKSDLKIKQDKYTESEISVLTYL